MPDTGLLGSLGRMRRRGKYSTVGGDMASKEERRIVAVPPTRNNRGLGGLYDIAEGVSRPTSPSTHLQQVFVLPLQVKKRKTMRKRIMESFREQKDLFMINDNEKHNGNTVGFEGYLKNNLDEKNNEINNLNMFVNEKDHKVTLIRSTTSVQSSFLIKKKRGNLMTSFREVINPGYQKKCNLPARISCNEQTISCKFGALGCPIVFPRSRPQSRLQHEASCRWIGVICMWGQDCSQETPLQDLASHLATKHGHLLRSITQEEGKSIKLSQVLPGHGETSWPDSSGCCSPTLIMISALNNTFLLFLRTAERFREDYDIAVAMLAPPQVAARYGYELRVFDEAGFAYRGPMLSVVVKSEQFWTQGYHLHIPNLDVLGSFFETTVRIFLRG